MFTLCYYTDIMLPLNVYYAAVVFLLILKVYYDAIIIIFMLLF